MSLAESHPPRIATEEELLRELTVNLETTTRKPLSRRHRLV
jgi:hypothetical protein